MKLAVSNESNTADRVQEHCIKETFSLGSDEGRKQAPLNIHFPAARFKNKDSVFITGTNTRDALAELEQKPLPQTKE